MKNNVTSDFFSEFSVGAIHELPLQQLPLQQLPLQQPLSTKLRPKELKSFFGQEHLLGEGKPLRKILEKKFLISFILWGSPGTGKTTLARIVASTLNAHFEEFSAVTSQVSDVRRVLLEAKKRLTSHKMRTILFVDEFHRFNKAQQDAFLPHLENGLLILIGATTENPYFVLNPALRSRVSIFKFSKLSEESISKIMERAINILNEKQNETKFFISDETKKEVILLANGDARTALNLLESAFSIYYEEGRHSDITPETIQEIAGQRMLDYSRKGDDRYDIVSAFIKSMRGSNPDAALYWLARMLESGEDPAFIARRMIIFAAEDIGVAEPNAIVVASATVNAVEFVGMPEARIPLGFCAVYLAACSKSNTAYKAIGKALCDVQTEEQKPVPLHLRNYAFGEERKEPDEYKYPHNFPNNFVKQHYFPAGMEEKIYYIPGSNGYEKYIKERVEFWRSKKKQGKG